MRRGAKALIAALAAVVSLFIVLALVLVTGSNDDDVGSAQRGVEAGPAVAGVQETRALLDGIPQEGFALGDPAAPVTLLEYVDLQCPFCRRHQLDVQPELIKELVKTGQAKLAFVPLAFLGADSDAARHVLVRLATRNRAWEFANLFYWNQGEEGSGYVTDAYLQGLVAEVPGATPADAAREADPAHATLLAAADALGQSVLGRREAGTPGFTVGRSGGRPSSYRWIPIYQGEPVADQLIRAVRKERTRVLEQRRSTPNGGDTA